jgi:hypothetical protein
LYGSGGGILKISQNKKIMYPIYKYFYRVYKRGGITMNVFLKPKCLTRFFKFDEYEIYCAGEKHEGTIEYASSVEEEEEIYHRLTGESLFQNDDFLYKENIPAYVRISEENIEKILKSEEHYEAYDPLEETPNLYTEMAKIKFFDIPSLKRFIENFGLPYGLDLFATDKYSVLHYEVDLFEFYDMLDDYKKALDIFVSLKSNNQKKIKKYAEEFKEYIKEESYEFISDSLKTIMDSKIHKLSMEEHEFDNYSDYVEFYFQILENEASEIKKMPGIAEKWRNIENSSPEKLANHYLVELLNDLSKGNSTFTIINDKIHPATTFRSLFEVACYQLSRAVIGNVDMKPCENCGALFEVTHESRRFCPPLPGHKISTCQNTYNQRMKRKRKKARELAAKGYTETQIAEKLKTGTQEIKEWLHT